MKYFLSRAAVLFFVVAGMVGCKCKETYKEVCSYPATWKGLLNDTSGTIYKRDELIIIYKVPPTDSIRNRLKERYAKKGITGITYETCSDCDSYVELWHAKGIETAISKEGGVSDATPASEDELAHYTLNFISKLPEFSSKPDSVNYRHEGRDTIRVAVLDTGFDTLHLANERSLYFMKSTAEFPNGSSKNCYPNAQYGWNFVNNSSNINDDHQGIHGTLMTQFILNEMYYANKNFVQIMSLKTHDSQGIGNLFNIICALHYAVKNKAQVINASWGFYYFDDIPHPYLSTYITDTLPDHGILFVAAAGNQSDSSDKYALNLKGDNFPLRDLNYHTFYPACLSNSSNNVLTVTTTDSMKVSSHQNYSARYVDLGVLADVITKDEMSFYWPFFPHRDNQSGSSFAAAIVSGTIAANIPSSLFQPGITKKTIINKLSSLSGPTNKPIVYTSNLLLTNYLIRNGKYIKHGAVELRTSNKGNIKKEVQ